MVTPTPFAPSAPDVEVVKIMTNNTMDLAIAALAGSAAGAIAGSIVRQLGHWLRSTPRPASPPEPDRGEDIVINQAAAQWAEEHGWVDHETRLADKLRLMRQLQRERRWRRGWPW